MLPFSPPTAKPNAPRSTAQGVRVDVESEPVRFASCPTDRALAPLQPGPASTEDPGLFLRRTRCLHGLAESLNSLVDPL